jgi:hypothetical protein
VRSRSSFANDFGLGAPFPCSASGFTRPGSVIFRGLCLSSGCGVCGGGDAVVREGHEFSTMCVCVFSGSGGSNNTLCGGLTILLLTLTLFSTSTCFTLNLGLGKSNASHHVSAESHLSFPCSKGDACLARARKLGAEMEVFMEAGSGIPRWPVSECGWCWGWGEGEELVMEILRWGLGS